MRKSGMRYLTAGVLLAVAAAACGGGSSGGNGGNGSGNGGANKASAPGVTATTVTIGSHTPLTGLAAPGYSEIAPASKAYFDYVNDNGGVNGRKIVYNYKDDAYDSAKTNTVVRQLVLQDKVFAIFNGLGTPTHEKVVDLLNSNKVPDLFVASGCLCWDQPQKHPYTFGWQPDYTVEGKILGQYITQHFAGKKVAYFTQNDDFGQNGVKGLDVYIPKSQVVSRQSYQSGSINIAPQVQAIQAAKPDVTVLFTVPQYTALYELTALKLGFKSQLVVSNVGSDPTTLSGLLEAFAKQGGTALQGQPLIQGIISDDYMPTDPNNSFYALFKKIHDQKIPKLPFDGNVQYGMSVAYTFVQALQAAGKNPTRDGIVKAIEAGGFKGPGLVPFRYSSTSHAGYIGTQIGVIKGNTLELQGQPLTTDDGSGPITPYTGGQPNAPANGIPTSG